MELPNNSNKFRKVEEFVFEFYDEAYAEFLDDVEAPKITVESNEVDFKTDLNEEQLKIVDNIQGPMLVIAGAGSGKTRTIVYSVAKLLVSGVKPSEIMLVTFTNKAAKEMIKRIETLLGKKPKGIWAGTFHSIASRFLRMYAKTLGLKPNYTIMDETDAKGLMKLSIDKADIKDLEERFPTPAMLKSILSFSINCNKTIREIIQWKHDQFDNDAIVAKLHEVINIYKNKKAEDSLVDFDDLLVFWNRLLDERFIAKLIAKKIKYVLVDEYQDTNYIQDEIIYKIVQQNPEHNLMVVGDDSQSIYAFRGANFQNILNFEKKYKECKRYAITQNYRSVPEILDLANESIKHNFSQYRKEMHTTRKNGMKPIHVSTDSDEYQAEFMVNMINQLKFEEFDLDDIAVLYRAGYHSLRIELELQKYKIPYVVHSGVSFFERAHVKDLLAHLRIIQNPQDEISWSRILSLFQGIGKKTSSKIFDMISAINNPLKNLISNNRLSIILDKLKIPKLVREEICDYLKKFFISIKYNKPNEVINKLILQLRKYLKIQYGNWQDRLEDLKQISIYSQNYDSIPIFLDTITLNKSTFESKKVGLPSLDNQSSLTLSTIHRAKGLEWKVVFIPMLSDNLFPSSKVKINSPAYEEERRIFYVAITRAKDRLFLISPKSIKVFKGQRELNTSQFIKELNPNVYKKEIHNYNNLNQLSLEEDLTKRRLKKKKELPLFTTADTLLKD
ncbi:MAG TPA: ATP-dependent helicase [Candidatus Nanopelagicaceae bacterium]|nr:ATP-dependent helicase [Candidatus Nanopelagicaceae bacterium]